MISKQKQSDDLLLAGLNLVNINDLLKDSVWVLIDVFPELSVQVQAFLKASSQRKAHLNRILLLATFPSFATNSHDSRMKGRRGTGVRAFFSVWRVYQ